MKNQNDLYNYFAAMVSDVCGVQFGEKQRRLVETRLQKRFRDLGLSNIEDYHQYFLSHPVEEKNQLISLLTTHHTYFFREFAHFEFILAELPELVKKLRAQGRKTIRVWSAASSHGEEAYSLAMFLTYHLKEIAPDIKPYIFGSDVCEASVRKAQNGVYTWDDLKKAPRNYITGKWLKGTGDIEGYVCAKKDLKELCEFKPMNLFQVSKSSFSEPFDFIFCRNVFIYFTSDQIKELVTKLLPHLAPHGHLVVGLSESLMHLGIELGHHGKSIYSLPKAKEVSPATQVESYVGAQKKKRVVCVDDSDVVLKLLERMFNDDSGYEVVGVARNGEEAAQVIAQKKPDYVTLDIHMPVLDGVSYLEKYYNSSHPSVLIVSSVSREERDLALKALRLGAKDYVEKPSLATFAKAKEEIFSKLGAMPITKSSSQILDLEASFAKNFNDRASTPSSVAVISKAGSSESHFLTMGLKIKGLVAREFEAAPAHLEAEFFNQIRDYFRSHTKGRYLFILGEIPRSYYRYLREINCLDMVFVEDKGLLEENERNSFSFKVEVCPVTSMVYEYGKVA